MTFNPELLEFDDPTHTYWYDGIVIPSVSQIIKASGSGVDYSTIPKYILERAAEIGTNAHKAVEEHHRFGKTLMSDDDKANEYLVGYRQFLSESGFVIFESERKLACPTYWFAGTVDLTGWINGKFSVLDVKTTSKLHFDTVELQLAAYGYLVEKFYGEKVEARYAVHLKKEGTKRYTLEPMNDPNARYQFLQMAMDYNGN